MVSTFATTRRLSLLSMLAVALVLALGLRTPLIASAQADPSASTSDVDFTKLKGIQYAVERTYIGDMSQIMAMMSTPSAGTPDLSSLGLFGLSGIALQFDNKSHASDSFDELDSQINASLKSSDSTMTIAETKIDKIGDKSKAYSASDSSSGMNMSFFFVISQKGKYIFAGVAIAFSGDTSSDAQNFTKSLVNAKGGDGLGTLKADGTSTDGLWKFFPKTGDDVLKGLKPDSDSELYPKDTSGN